MLTIKTNIIVKFSLIITVIVACGSVGIYWVQSNNNEQQMHTIVNAIQDTFGDIKEQETINMKAAIISIKYNDAIKLAFINNNREELHAKAENLFNELKYNNITHFYFHDYNRVNILRVHKPERYGDLINRATIRLAHETGNSISGLELGPLGNFVLRTVSPWYDGEKLIGFVELGKEIDQMSLALRERFNVDIYFFVAKKHLKLSDWQAGMKMLERPSDWDAFVDNVIITKKTPPPFLKHLEQDFNVGGMRSWYNVPQSDQHFNVSRLPINNIINQELAFMVIVQDVTDQVHQSQRIIAVGIVVGILGGVGLILLFGGLLNLVENKLKNSKKREQLTLEFGLDAIITIDVNGIVEEINPAAETMFGYAKDDLVGRPIAEYIIPQEFRQLHTDALIRHANYQGELVSLRRRIELQGLRADGQLIDLEVVLISIFIDGQKHYTAFMHDITDRKQLLKSLKETLNTAESANRLKSEFLSNMSHEIRSPMNAIMGMTELILNTDLTEYQRENLKIVENSANTLLGLINDILDLSKIESGRLSLENFPFDLRGCVEKVCESLAVRAHQKDIELYCDIEIDISTLIGDSLRLNQIISNLISNAIKFTSEGEVIVRVERIENEHDINKDIFLHFSIQDTGIGIPNDHITAIFERFFQVDGSATRNYGGAGLGLAISKHLVEMMNGKIWAESEVGKGSIFHFTARFGTAQRNDINSERDINEARRHQPAPSHLAEVRILIGDINATGRQIIKKMLSSFGANVEETSDISSLIKVLQTANELRRPFDIILLDHDIFPLCVNGTGKKECLTSEEKIIIREENFKSMMRFYGTEKNACKTVDENLMASDFDLHHFIFNKDYKRKILRMIPSHLFMAEHESNSLFQITTILKKPIKLYSLLKEIDRCLGRYVQDDACGSLLRIRRALTIPLRILLVEDLINNQKLATTILERAGHTVILANNGREALDFLAINSVDLILMDLNMPNMNGYETTRMIRHEENAGSCKINIPIIAVTALATQSEEKKCLEAGMNGYLRKPYHEIELLGIIETFCNKHERVLKKTSRLGFSSNFVPVKHERESYLSHQINFIEEGPEHLNKLHQALLDHNVTQVIKQAKWIELAADRIGANANRVKIRAIRLKGKAEMREWEQMLEVMNDMEQEIHKVNLAFSEAESKI
ncbi:MAG: response regulator [Magnetococcales bacterium]|nr:response regulator [Magnetococcales bacterium]